MARFNQGNAGPVLVENEAGGEAYPKSPKLELVSMLLTNFVQDQFYRKTGDTLKRLGALVKECPPEFCAKAAVYARDHFGMRSISHAVAGELAAQNRTSREPWATAFYDKIVVRPDDMLEIIAYYRSHPLAATSVRGNQKVKLPAALKRGFGRAMGRFDSYQLGKYRGEGKSVKLVDVVNLVHPGATERNRDALAALVGGTLKAGGTWEANLTAAGQRAAAVDGTEEEKAEALAMEKGTAWAALVEARKLGHFALLRNMRNISQQAPDSLEAALVQLIAGVGKARVLPFRYLTALGQFQDPGPLNKVIRDALSACMDAALANVPKLSGRTLVAVDMSGSTFAQNLSDKSGVKVADIATIFGAVLGLSNDADVLAFSDRRAWVSMVKGTPVVVAALQIVAAVHGGGTDFRLIFDNTNGKYERIIVLSDNEAWIGHTRANETFKEYKRRTGADPKMFVFDLAGMPSMQFPESNTYFVAGFSEKVFDLMAAMEQDRDALVNAVEAVSLA